MPGTTRILTALLALSAAAALDAGAPTASAAPDTGSAAGSSAGGCGPRTGADQPFLRESSFDEEPCPVQDTASRLARTDCRCPEAQGNSTLNRIALAENNRGTVDYPYILVKEAIVAHCPRHQR